MVVDTKVGAGFGLGAAVPGQELDEASAVLRNSRSRLLLSDELEFLPKQTKFTYFSLSYS